MQPFVNNGKSKGTFVKVHGRRYLIGRSPRCQLRPRSAAVSPLHSELTIVRGVAVIRDLGSATGTRLNGATLAGPTPVRNGDRIEIGPLCLTALLDDADRRPVPRPRAIEDQVANWLADDGEAPDSVTPDAAPTQSEVRLAGTAPGTSPDADAEALLAAMTVRTD